MKKYNFKRMSIPQIEKTIVEMRAETEVLKKEIEALKKETTALKKAGEAKHPKNLDEIEVIKKETAAMNKAGEAKHLKNLDEIEARKKEKKAIDKRLSDNFDKLLKQVDITNATMEKYGLNLGSTEIFANSIEKTMEVDKVKYNTMVRNYSLLSQYRDVLCEIDILLFNKKYICIIEIQYHATLAHLIKLTEKIIPIFIKEETRFKNYKILSFIAAMSFDKKVLESAKDKKIGLLKYRGEHFKLVETK